MSHGEIVMRRNESNQTLPDLGRAHCSFKGRLSSASSRRTGRNSCQK